MPPHAPRARGGGGIRCWHSEWACCARRGEASPKIIVDRTLKNLISYRSAKWFDIQHFLCTTGLIVRLLARNLFLIGGTHLFCPLDGKTGRFSGIYSLHLLSSCFQATFKPYFLYWCCEPCLFSTLSRARPSPLSNVRWEQAGESRARMYIPAIGALLAIPTFLGVILVPSFYGSMFFLFLE